MAYHFKQWGEWAPTTMHERLTARLDGELKMGQTLMMDGGVKMSRLGKKRAGRLLDGREWNEMPR